ncbi:hypothetical protein SAMN05428977_10166 [Nitrosomonas sp. Nm166]|nr:hypothetical protein SAMN05428977_10166 [Nitrosomonas sp. Nm166]
MKSNFLIEVYQYTYYAANNFLDPDSTNKKTPDYRGFLCI